MKHNLPVGRSDQAAVDNLLILIAFHNSITFPYLVEYCHHFITLLCATV